GQITPGGRGTPFPRPPCGGNPCASRRSARARSTSRCRSRSIRRGRPGAWKHRSGSPTCASTPTRASTESPVTNSTAPRNSASRAIKLRIHNETPAEDIAQVAAVRKAVGDRMAIMADANQTDVHDAPFPGPHWSFHRALATAQALAEYRVEWLEEPLPRHDYEGLRRLRAVSPVPIAGGEVNQGFAELERLLRDGCYDILQPDVTLCEGLLRMRALASMAHASSALL